MSETPTFDTLALDHHPSRGCARCGEKPAGQLRLQLFRLREDKPVTGKTISSRTRALCEPCAVQAYREMDGLFSDFLNGAA